MVYALIRDGVVVHTIAIGSPRPGMVEAPPHVESGWVATATEDAEEPWLFEAPPPQPEPGPPALTMISKDGIWRRATDEEAEQMEAALQAQPVRLRRIYEGATFISTSDELFGVLETALVTLFGAERAAELLEPTG